MEVGGVIRTSPYSFRIDESAYLLYKYIFVSGCSAWLCACQIGFIAFKSYFFASVAVAEFYLNMYFCITVI